MLVRAYLGQGRVDTAEQCAALNALYLRADVDLLEPAPTYPAPGGEDARRAVLAAQPWPHDRQLVERPLERDEQQRHAGEVQGNPAARDRRPEPEAPSERPDAQ